MAKKKIDEQSGGFDFGSFAKSMQKFNPESFVLDDRKDIAIENWIGTGNYTLNAQISGDIYKGIPEGRIVILGGANSTGKTFLSLNICKEAQKQGYGIVWIDTENSLDDETIDRFGIDRNKFLYSPMNIILDVSTFLLNMVNDLKVKNLNNNPKILVVIDSLGNLSTTKEMEDVLAGSDKADMTRAKELRKMFRVLTKDLGILKIPVVITNHIYGTIGMFSTQEFGGGEGSKYNSSLMLMLSKAQLKETQTGPAVGIVVTCKLKKSRFTIPYSIHFHISFFNGMNPYVGLEEFIGWDVCGIDYGKIEKGEFIKTEKKTTIAVKHLGKHIPFRQLYTSKVFTPEVLDILRPIIKKHFELPPSNDEFYNEIDEVLEIENEE